MPNTHSTLASLFTDIANAIRGKTGSSAQIIADNFPTEISNIPAGVDPSDATAIAGDILSGKTAYISTGKVEGTMTNRGAWTGATTGSGNVTIPEGYHSGSGYVSGSGAYNAGRVQGRTDAIANNGQTFISSTSFSVTQGYYYVLVITTNTASAITISSGATLLLQYSGCTFALSGTTYYEHIAIFKTTGTRVTIGKSPSNVTGSANYAIKLGVA